MLAQSNEPFTFIGCQFEKKMPFDVFLSHNSQDKPSVRELGELLKKRGLTVWLDEWELIPGRPWQEALEDVIGTTESAAVLVGGDGIGPWQTPEMRAALSQFVEKGLPVIPVLLPGAPSRVDLPLFLQSFSWVDLRGGFSAERIDRLVWGITGAKPGEDTSTKRADQRAYRPITFKPKLDQYTNLDRLLKSRKWKDANKETQVLLKKFAPDDLVTIGSEELQTIDRLWGRYSDGLFGFSVQKKILLEADGNMGDFWRRVAWVDRYSIWSEKSLESGLIFSLNAPRGHLPFILDLSRFPVSKLLISIPLPWIAAIWWSSLDETNESVQRLKTLLSRQDL